MTPSVVVAGGGTAGHVYPGLALANALRAERADVAIRFVGTARGIETTAVPAAGFGLDLIDVVPWAKTLGARRYLAPAALVRATAQARSILSRAGATVVVGMGGYASMPVVLAARAMRIPAVLHEQNAVPGIANLAGARVTREIALGFDEARRYFPRGAHVRVVGTPIRESVATLDRAALRVEARTSLGLKPETPTLAIFGGSLGAARLNTAVAELSAAWAERDDRQILAIAGRAHAESLRERATGAVILDYLDRMELAYAAADIVIARAGAATVAETSAVGLPAILVPYPYARRDHQAANARAYASGGGAIVVPDAEATATRFGRLVDGVLGDPERIAAMSAAARSLAKPHAAQRLAAWVLEIAGRR